LQQKKLAEMITEITKAQLLTETWCSRMKDAHNQISMAKRNNVDMAIPCCACEARQMLGGMLQVNILS
jgi:glutaryl-CoA dehydrogenase